MKKIFSYAMMLLAGTFAMTSCEKDLDSNPTLIQPSSFVLNNPEVGNGVVDLEKSDGISITWSQPEYTTKNAPVVATYYVQLSTTAKFTKEFLATAEDNTGADYITLDESSKVCTADINAAEVAKALQKLNAYAEGVDLAVEKVSLRLKAAVVDQALKEHNVVYSNVVAFNAKPYYVELKDATPVMWYLVGNMFGGKWGLVVGESALPMFLKDGFAYDKKTGTGELEYINYFLTGTFDNTDGNESSVAGFKIQRTDFNWDFGLTGDSGKYGVIKYRDGKKDGGEIGSGHRVTVLYEIVDNDSPMEIGSDLKYQTTAANDSNDLLNIAVRYKEPDSETSKELNYPVSTEAIKEEMSDNMKFAAAVAQTGMLLRDSEFKGKSSYDSVVSLLDSIPDIKNDTSKLEFLLLVKKMATLVKEQ